ncbi:hypothetical protein CCC_01762 [Paramagnetospirillum magnetotacticum MS-1]|uniref:Uncharacterized protein n=1 Tax=Paramagnetospirillum magnetotacticum MS-1 TaxID=272627 RepID=A0A0C2UGR7_PARME|nr:hypothetical protein [Paramagnetospirillum magnetotacticum]KIM00768.1 hypothetical protein CCC_01762 [Paramagnetospirillum magnetotacticum MS-1]
MRLPALLILALTVWAAAAQAETKPTVPCLTCPRIVPACWMMVYRWTDYNLRSGPGNHLVITDGPPPTRPELAKAAEEVIRSLPKGMKTALVGTSRIDCPEPIKAESRKP